MRAGILILKERSKAFCRSKIQIVRLEKFRSVRPWKNNSILNLRQGLSSFTEVEHLDSMKCHCEFQKSDFLWIGWDGNWVPVLQMLFSSLDILFYLGWQSLPYFWYMHRFRLPLPSARVLILHTCNRLRFYGTSMLFVTLQAISWLWFVVNQVSLINVCLTICPTCSRGDQSNKLRQTLVHIW